MANRWLNPLPAKEIAFVDLFYTLRLPPPAHWRRPLSPDGSGADRPAPDLTGSLSHTTHMVSHVKRLLEHRLRLFLPANTFVRSSDHGAHSKE